MRRLRSTNSTEATSLALSIYAIGLSYTLISLSYVIYTRQQTTLKLATSSIIEKTKMSIGVADISSILKALSATARNNSFHSWKYFTACPASSYASANPRHFIEILGMFSMRNTLNSLSRCVTSELVMSCVTLHVTRGTRVTWRPLKSDRVSA